MKKFALLLTFLVLTLLFCINVINVTADETNPCTIYGTVKDENGMVVGGTIITIENINSKERNSVSNDTIIGLPIQVITDSNGIYTFELINLKSGYSDGDEIIVTAEKDGIIGSKSIIVREGNWGVRADIILGIEENQKKETWYGSLSNIWMLLFIMFLLVLILILTMFKRYKPKEISSSLMDTKKKLPPTPLKYKPRRDILSSKKEKEIPIFEDEIPEDELPPPEDEILENDILNSEDDRQKRFGSLSRIGILYILLGEIIVIILKFFIKNNIEVL